MSKINVENAILVVIDYQEKLFPYMSNKDEAADNTAKLIKGCRILGVPIIATQQYTKGLGETVDTVKNALIEPIGDDIPATTFKHVEKKTFSCMEEETFKEALINSGKEQVILCGIESHICVQQTAIDMYEYSDDFEEFDYDDDDIENIENNVVVLMDRSEEDDEDYFDGTDFEVFLACDCIASRKEFDRDIAIKRMAESGIELMTMESILFEMTIGSENPAFKKISKTVK